MFAERLVEIAKYFETELNNCETIQDEKILKILKELVREAQKLKKEIAKVTRIPTEDDAVDKLGVLYIYTVLNIIKNICY